MMRFVFLAQEVALTVAGQGILPARTRWIAALVCGAIGLWMMFPVWPAVSRVAGGILTIIAAMFVLGNLSPQRVSFPSVLFWSMAGLTVGAAVATIMARRPVYSAIWFAVVLLGTAGLLLINGAQFLGIATLVVYAGAIVVTFLFVLMLSQPEGQSFYDRFSWGPVPAAVATFSGMTLVVVLSWSISLGGEALQSTSSDEVEAVSRDLMTPYHVATVGRHLFTKYLLAVQVAGVLLLAALVGAISMAEHGNAAVVAVSPAGEPLPSGEAPRLVNGESGGDDV